MLFYSQISDSIYVLTVHPFPRSRRQTRFFLRTDPDQLGFEPGFPAFQFGGQKRRSRPPESVRNVAADRLTLLSRVGERGAAVHVELVTPVVENGHVGLPRRTSRRAPVDRKFYFKNIHIIQFWCLECRTNCILQINYFQ